MQDGLVAFFRKLACNRIVKEEGFRFLKNSNPITSLVPSLIEKMPAKARNCGGSGQNGLFYMGKALG